MTASRHARRFFGENASARRLSRLDVQRFTQHLVDAGLADKSVNGYIKALGVILEQGVEWGYLDANPARKVRNLPPNKRAKDAIRVISPTEHEALVTAAPPGYRVMFCIWPFVGLRRSEMQGLTWADLDLDTRQLHVRRQLRDDGTLDTNLKTLKSARTVDIPVGVVSELRQWKLKCKPTALDLVFPTPRGLAQSCRSQFYKLWKRVVLSAGLEGVDPHDMRHTFATWSLAAGESARRVADQMGHEKPSMTLDTYSHLLPAEEGKSASKIADWYESQAARDGHSDSSARILPVAAESVVLPVSA